MFAARPLLRRPEVVLLDETFGTLDPRSAAAALEVAVAEAPALLVVRQ